MGTFGDQLKREREMRGVSLDEIAIATRIAPRFLLAIENEQWAELPGGIFNRGFVRAVARYLGLDEEKILADYGSSTGDRPSVPVWTGSPPAVTPDRPWLPITIAAAGVLVLLLAAWFSARRIYAWRATRHSAAVVGVGVKLPPPSPDSASPAPLNPAAAGGGSSAVAASAALESSREPPAANVAAAAGPTPALTGTSSAAPAQPSGAMPTPASAPPAVPAKTPAPANAPLALKIETLKATHVSVRVDGRRAFGGTIRLGQARTFNAQDKFEISARDAGAVQLTLNGKSLAAIGRAGHSAKTTLTRDSLNNSPGGGN